MMRAHLARDVLTRTRVHFCHDGVWLVVDEGDCHTHAWPEVVERTVRLWSGQVHPDDIRDGNASKRAIAAALRAAAERVEQAIEPEVPAGEETRIDVRR